MPTDRLPVRRHSLSLAVLAVAGLLLAACSGATTTPSASESAAESSAAASSASESAAASEDTGGDEITVTLVGFEFTGDEVDASGDTPTLTIPAGTTVNFVNEDTARHTATHGVDGMPDAAAAFDIDLPEAGASGSFTFDTAGSFGVTCKVHPEMNMTIVVE